MLSREPGNDQTGRVRLEPLGPGRTRLHFEERYHLVSAPWRWFEGPIYRFINRQNEASMRRLSEWLTAHPEYRPDLRGLAAAASHSFRRRARERPRSAGRATRAGPQRGSAASQDDRTISTRRPTSCSTDQAAGFGQPRMMRAKAR